MSTILSPIAPQAFLNDNHAFFGAVELDVESRDVVWTFDAIQMGFDPPTYTQDGEYIKREGFRPASVQRLSSGMTLISGWHRGFVVDEDGDIHAEFTNRLMNDTHEIQQTSDGTYLVASTGMDTIFELDEDFDELWRWHMWEHVDTESRPEDYYPPDLLSTDCRAFAMYPDDRYHLNYITETENGDLLASALNYGIFTIDRETGRVRSSYTDLDECHNPVRTGDTYVVCESGKDRVIRVSPHTGTEVLFTEGLKFVKDADPIDNDGNWLIADTKNDRVLVWNVADSAPKREFYLCEDANPYEADYLTN